MKYILFVILLSVGVLFLLATNSKRIPDNLGLVNGKLAQCPDKKNCVSSQSTSDQHTVAPLKAAGTSSEVMNQLKSAVESMEGGMVVKTTSNYLLAEFTTPLWKFKDDLECLYDADQKLVHVRSASRMGYYDFDANRKRVEALRLLLSQSSDAQ